MPGWFTAAVGGTHLAGEHGAELSRELLGGSGPRTSAPRKTGAMHPMLSPAAKHLEM